VLPDSLLNTKMPRPETILPPRPRGCVLRTCARAFLVGLLASFTAAGLAPAAQAGFGIKTWEAGTCKVDVPECLYTSPESQFYHQAAGHPPLGITAFEVNTSGLGAPEGQLKDVRVDIPPASTTVSFKH
jgi:hypothetical protein